MPDGEFWFVDVVCSTLVGCGAAGSKARTFVDHGVVVPALTEQGKAGKDFCERLFHGREAMRLPCGPQPTGIAQM